MTTEQTLRGDPPDGGYGWVILAIASFCMFLINGIGKTSGMIFSAIIDRYHVSRTQATIIFVTYRMLSFGSAPIASKLLGRYTYKTVFYLSGFMMSSGFILMSFCTEIWQIVLTFSFLLASGNGMLLTTAGILIGVYFKQRKSFAFGIYFTFAGVGCLVLPVLFGYLLEEYGYFWTIRILGAIAIHPCVLGMLVRQPTWISKKKKEKKNLLLEQGDQNCMENPSKNDKQLDDHVDIVKKRNKLHRIAASFVSGLRNDLKVFKDATFVSLLISRMGSAFPLFMILSYIPDYIKYDYGGNLSDKDIAYVIGMSSIGDIVAPFVLGYLLEKFPWRKKYTMSGIGIISAVIFASFQFASTYTILFVLVIAYGLMAGNYLVCHMVLMTELVGPIRLPLVHGLLQFFLGIAVLVGGLTVGYIRDVTGSYVIGFYIFSGSALCGGIVWYFEPLLRKCLPSPTIKEIEEEKIKLRLQSVQISTTK